MIGRPNTGLMLAGALGAMGASVDDFIPSKYKPKHQAPQGDQEKAEKLRLAELNRERKAIMRLSKAERDLGKFRVIKFEIETIKRGEWVKGVKYE